MEFAYSISVSNSDRRSPRQWPDPIQYRTNRTANWDYVVLVRYPSRAAFLDMMGSPEYAAANVHREQAVAKHVILAAAETYSKMKQAG